MLGGHDTLNKLSSDYTYMQNMIFASPPHTHTSVNVYTHTIFSLPVTLRSSGFRQVPSPNFHVLFVSFGFLGKGFLYASLASLEIVL